MKIFVAYLAITVVLPIAFGIIGSISGIYALWYVWRIINFVRFFAHPVALVHTHDMTCRLNPQLGQPIFFKH